MLLLFVLLLLTFTMSPRIEHIEEKKLVGLHIQTTLADNQTPALFRSFISRRREPENRLNANIYSVQVYDTSIDFRSFTPTTPFEKWAAVEVAAFGELPPGMEALIVPAGLYAVFLYKGLPQDFPSTAQYIFGTWLPQSEYIPDNRPHFEIMSPAYRPDDPAAEEEVWVPVKRRES